MTSKTIRSTAIKPFVVRNVHNLFLALSGPGQYRSADEVSHWLRRGANLICGGSQATASKRFSITLQFRFLKNASKYLPLPVAP